MAQRRMFSPEIVCSDAFVEMPASSRDLYFQLGMRADDDGFVPPRGIMRWVGASEDDLKILIAKRFVLPFENGVIVIKHWRMNNLIRKDWYRPSKYLEERKQLYIKENGAYTLDELQGEPLVTESLPNRQHRIGKDSIDKKEIANAISPLSEVKEVRLNNEGNEKPIKEKRTSDPAWILRKKLYEMLAKELGKPPIESVADLKMVKRALRTLSEKQVLEMFEEALAAKTVYTVREVLTDRQVEIYRQDI